jgi:hypothetical protein
MVNRRMFAKSIINSAAFIKMPPSSQMLYFHLALNADDDGVVEAFTVMRMVGVSEDDLKILVAKKFVTILNEDLVTWINDWNEHNTIRADRKVDSKYQTLLLQVVGNIKLLEAKPRSDRRKNDKHGTYVGLSQDGEGAAQAKLSEAKLIKANISKDNNAREAPDNLSDKFVYLQNDKFKQAFNDFGDMRKKIRKPQTEKAKELTLTKLHKYPVETSINMLEQSIANSWSDVYPPKDNGATSIKGGLTTAQQYGVDSMLRLKKQLIAEGKIDEDGNDI